jgi:hypothetical protein
MGPATFFFLTEVKVEPLSGENVLEGIGEDVGDAEDTRASEDVRIAEDEATLEDEAALEDEDPLLEVIARA